MTVLVIIGLIVGALVLFGIICVVNDRTYNRFGFEMFNMENFILIAITNVIVYYGYDYLVTALNNPDKDILNGIVMIAVGIIVYISLMIYNIKKSNFNVGFFGTIIQLAIYAIFTIPAILIVMGALAVARPVFRIDN